MSPEQRKKQITQVIILVVLLGVMIAMVFLVLMPALRGNTGGKPAPAGQRQAGQQQATAPSRGSTATDMPVVPGSGAGIRPAGNSAEGVEFISGVPVGLNPNLFQVFDLQVPRNPFVQLEDWYADEIEEALPGYPELRDSEYFDSMEPYLPDVSALFGDRDWSEVRVQRNQRNTYSLTGTNPDGTIDTNITLEENIPTNNTLTWTPDSGIPLESLSDPDFVADLNLPSNGALGGGGLDGGMALPDSSDLFGGPGAGGLPTMDGYLPGGGDPSQLGPNGALVGIGDQLTCRGVNHAAQQSTALIDFNGMPFLVKKGDVLPTHYEVLEVKQDGVMIKELRDGSTMWLPLTLLLEPAAADNNSDR